MNTSDLDYTPNPLTDTFHVRELRLVAPWIWEDVQRLGEDRLLLTIRQWGADPGRPQRMQTYFAALRQLDADQRATG